MRQSCRAARLPAVAANFERMAGEAAKANQTHIRYFDALLRVECEERDRHAVENRIRDAQLPAAKTLEWTGVFPNPRLCKAVLDRVTDRAHIIETGTESYRFRRTMEGKQKRK